MKEGKSVFEAKKEKQKQKQKRKGKKKVLKRKEQARVSNSAECLNNMRVRDVATGFDTWRLL